MSYSILKLSEEAGAKIMYETPSSHRAKTVFQSLPVNQGEQIVLRYHGNNEIKAMNVRNNGYCA